MYTHFILHKDFILYTLIYKVDKQQGPTVQHRELYSVPSNNL